MASCIDFPVLEMVIHTGTVQQADRDQYDLALFRATYENFSAGEVDRMIFGNVQRFAIETEVTKVYPRDKGQRTQQALGFFIVYIKNHVFGVRSPDATTLGFVECFIRERIEKKNVYAVPWELPQDSAELVNALFTATVREDSNNQFGGLSNSELYEFIIRNDIAWTGSLDEAFDGGDHLLQIEYKDQVQIIAFRVSDEFECALSAEITLPASEFYAVLSGWHKYYLQTVDTMLKEL